MLRKKSEVQYLAGVSQKPGDFYLNADGTAADLWADNRLRDTPEEAFKAAAHLICGPLNLWLFIDRKPMWIIHQQEDSNGE